MRDPHPSHGRDGPGIAPLIVSGVACGLVCAVSTGLLGGSWLLVLASYCLAGTVGTLGAALVASGIARDLAFETGVTRPPPAHLRLAGSTNQGAVR